jgi:predicted Rossmann-fold nucleotide-binding protein
MQTGKLQHFPLVGMGGDFWTHLRSFDLGTMVTEGVISPEHTDLIQRADSVEDAIRIIQNRSAPDGLA